MDKEPYQTGMYWFKHVFIKDTEGCILQYLLLNIFLAVLKVSTTFVFFLIVSGQYWTRYWQGYPQHWLLLNNVSFHGGSSTLAFIKQC